MDLREKIKTKVRKMAQMRADKKYIYKSRSIKNERVTRPDRGSIMRAVTQKDRRANPNIFSSAKRKKILKRTRKRVKADVSTRPTKKSIHGYYSGYN